MQKSSRSSLGGAVCSIKENHSEMENLSEMLMDENDGMVDKIEQLQLEINQMRRGQWQKSNRSGSWNNQGYRKEANGNQKSVWKSTPPSGNRSSNSKSQLCLHCSHHSGSLSYHSNAHVSGGDNCFYDKNGVKRGSTNFGNRVASVDTADQSDDNALRRYYE